MSSSVTRETLRRMIDEFELIPMSDDELDVAVPQVQALVNAISRTNHIDLANVRTSHVFVASTSGIAPSGDTIDREM